MAAAVADDVNTQQVSQFQSFVFSLYFADVTWLYLPLIADIYGRLGICNDCLYFGNARVDINDLLMTQD